MDAYAKRIFPLIDDALAGGGTLDDALVLKLVAAHGTPDESSVTPR